MQGTGKRFVWAALLAITTAATACNGSDPGGGDPPDQPSTVVNTPGVKPAWFDPDHAGLPASKQKPRVAYPVAHGVSAPLASILHNAPRASLKKGGAREVPLHRGPTANLMRKKPGTTVDPVIDRTRAAFAPAPTLNFEGVSNIDNSHVVGGQVAPPDPNGDVGPNNYVQWVNLSLAVYDKAGNLLAGPSAGNTPWTGMTGSSCATSNDGDPLVIYDSLADRWVFSQFALSNDGHQCFAISTTPDPLGPYYVYDYLITTNGINDYPKLGLWPDGYYLSIREFANSGAFTNAVVAFDREAMVQGLSAGAVRFNITDPNLPNMDTVLPSHLEGRVMPPAGAPNYIVHASDDELEGANPDPSNDQYDLWAMHVDWVDPSQSTLTGPLAIKTPEFDANLCFGNCIPQPGTTNQLDALSPFTMYRLAYRNFGDHESLVVDHTVNAGGGQAGIRWTELRNPSTTPELFQTGTYAPGDGQNRWMGSVAMDGSGNLAVGYSVASATTFPSLRYAARLAGDPAGELGQGEAEIVTGASSEEGLSRWGDYFAMSVDESDDCTFWFTGEYMGAEGGINWHTRIASFSLPGCQAKGVGSLTGTITDANGAPLVAARVHAGVFSALTGSDGHYAINLVPGTYDVRAEKVGYFPSTQTGLVVAEGDHLTADFALETAPVVETNGFVYDATHAMWPLYAKIVFSAPGAAPVVAFTDPTTGYYTANLFGGTEYATTVTSLVPGYLPLARPVTPVSGTLLVSFGLDVNIGTCVAPGYSQTIAAVLTEPFEAGVPPAGWTVDNTTTNCASPYPAWTDADPSGFGNRTGGAGRFASADSYACGPGSAVNTTLTSPPLDLSALGPDAALRIELDQEFFAFLATTQARIEIWNGTAWLPVATQSTTIQGHAVFGTQAANGVADARVRFVYSAADQDVWWQLDNVVFSTVSACEYHLGGLVLGTVVDENTGGAVNGATVTVGGQTTTTRATPEDPNLPDGFWMTWVPAAPTQLTATARHYGTLAQLVIPQVNGARRYDLALPAGKISVAPAALRLRVPWKSTNSTTFTVSNTGGAPATVEFGESAARVGNRPHGPFDTSRLRVEGEGLNEPDAAQDHLPVPSFAVRHRDAGVSAKFPTGVPGVWGIAFDRDTGSTWLGAIAGLNGDSKLHEFKDTVATGRTIAMIYDNVFAADGTYDTRNHTLWQLNVGGDDCIHEVNPTAGQVTGNVICPAFGTNERGLAYDDATDTFYAGSWTDGRIVQFDRSGTILRAVALGLNTSGLAYNSRTGHLFALTNDAATAADVYVIDSTDLSVVGTLELADNGVPAFGDYEQAGLELDCNGNFLAVNQAKSAVIVAASGEETTCLRDLPWLTESPNPITVAAHTTATVTVTADAATLTPGLRLMQLDLATDTPYDVPALPLAVTVAFSDVSPTNPADPYIHALAGAGIAYGCGAGNFCPGQPLPRSYYTVWGLRALLGALYNPAPATGLIFNDVAPESYAAEFVEDIATRGLMDGCAPGLFCPTARMPRGTSAQILLRGLEGPSYVPPAAVGKFTDVPAADPTAPWIEELARRGIDAGCGGGKFCPAPNLTRAAMATWMVKAYHLPVLLP